MEKLQKRQEEQNGITLCRGAWTINYISQKEAQWNSPATHSANSAPLLDTHIHKHNTHTLLSFLSSSSGRDDHLILDKLSCSLSSSFTQNLPCLPHPSAALKESRKVKSVCESRERGEKEKKKIWDVLLSKYYTWETLIQKKKKEKGGETGLGFKQHLTNIVALTSSIRLSPFSNCIIPLTHPMSQIQLQAAANSNLTGTAIWDKQVNTWIIRFDVERRFPSVTMFGNFHYINFWRQMIHFLS